MRHVETNQIKYTIVCASKDPTKDPTKKGDSPQFSTSPYGYAPINVMPVGGGVGLTRGI